MRAVMLKPKPEEKIESHIGKLVDGFSSCGVGTVNTWNSFYGMDTPEKKREALKEFENYKFTYPYGSAYGAYGNAPILMACLSEGQVYEWEKYLLEAGWKIVVDSIPNTYHQPINSKVTLYIKINHTANPEDYLKVV